MKNHSPSNAWSPPPHVLNLYTKVLLFFRQCLCDMPFFQTKIMLFFSREYYLRICIPSFDMILIFILILHWSPGSMMPPSQCCFLEEEWIEHKLLPIKEMIFNWFFWGDFSSARQGNSRGLIESTAWPSLLISSRFPIATHDWCFGWYGAVYKCTNVLVLPSFLPLFCHQCLPLPFQLTQQNPIWGQSSFSGNGWICYRVLM